MTNQTCAGEPQAGQPGSAGEGTPPSNQPTPENRLEGEDRHSCLNPSFHRCLPVAPGLLNAPRHHHNVPSRRFYVQAQGHEATSVASTTCSYQRGPRQIQTRFVGVFLDLSSTRHPKGAAKAQSKETLHAFKKSFKLGLDTVSRKICIMRGQVLPRMPSVTHRLALA